MNHIITTAHNQSTPTYTPTHTPPKKSQPYLPKQLHTSNRNCSPPHTSNTLSRYRNTIYIESHPSTPPIHSTSPTNTHPHQTSDDQQNHPTPPLPHIRKHLSLYTSKHIIPSHPNHSHPNHSHPPLTAALSAPNAHPQTPYLHFPLRHSPAHPNQLAPTRAQNPTSPPTPPIPLPMSFRKPISEKPPNNEH